MLLRPGGVRRQRSLLENRADGSIKSSAPLVRWAFDRVSGELNEALTVYQGYYRHLHGEAIEP